MSQGKVISFENLSQNKDAYNPSRIFSSNDNKFVLVRVESKDKETDTQIYVAQSINESLTKWHLEDKPILNMQDPYVTHINNKLIVGGVELFKNNNGLSWRNSFYQGNSINDLKHLFNGPHNMKGIRFGETSNGEIIVFTRPQSNNDSECQIGGRGKIGFMQCTSLEELANYSSKDFENAPLLSLGNDKVWVGGNDFVKNHNDKIIVNEKNNIAFIFHEGSYIKQGNEIVKQYIIKSGLLDIITKEITNQKTIVTSDDFKTVRPKRKDLQDIVYPGGPWFDLNKPVIQQEKGYLMVGISDTHAGIIPFKNPLYKTNNK